MKPLPGDTSAETCPWCGHVIVVDSNYKSPDPMPKGTPVYFWAGCSNADDCPVEPRTWDCGSMEEAEALWDRRVAPLAGPLTQPAP